MIGRLATAFAVVAAAVAAAGLAGGGDDDATTYRIQLRNAFDLTEGGDFKVRGVPAGVIRSIDVDRRRLVAVVTVAIDKPGPVLRRSATCESRPQSLIGEYFVSCDPGTGAPLPSGSEIPLGRTRSTIPQDLVNDILRVPYRQRLTLVLNELGLGLAGRGDDLNDAIREGVPALRETDRVLSVLSDQRHRLAGLVTSADRVTSALARRRHSVSRFVRDAGRAATVSAERRGALAAGLRRLPGFLSQLRSTMTALDRFSDAQTPVAVHLGQVARPLARFLADLEPYLRSSRPAVRALGRASATGRTTAAAATPTAQQVAEATRHAPELSKNLRFVLEHLDDRSFGAEHDDRAVSQLAAPGPGGDRYTGLEGFLQYGFDQGADVTTYNQNGHFLILDVLAAGRCANFADADTVRNDPALERDCSGKVYGPSSPGIHDPDPGRGASVHAARSKRGRTARAAVGDTASSTAQSLDGESQALDYLLGP